MGVCCFKPNGVKASKPTIKEVLVYTKKDLSDKDKCIIAYEVVESWIYRNPNDKLRPKVEEKRKMIKEAINVHQSKVDINPQVRICNLDSGGKHRR